MLWSVKVIIIVAMIKVYRELHVTIFETNSYQPSLSNTLIIFIPKFPKMVCGQVGQRHCHYSLYTSKNFKIKNLSTKIIKENSYRQQK